ncbi:O-antigen ligase family protein [Trichloromonas sp.]|uniref:O-antigen ligase family protein n=1 Tax=Trichloromonas sp. TaxID=3069249 RepID=UPI003D8183B8
MSCSVVAGIALLQFVWLPWLGDGNQVAKQFLFLFGTLGASLAYLAQSRRLWFPRALWPAVLLAGGAICSAVQAPQAATAWVGAGVMLSCLLFLLLVIQLARPAAAFFDLLVKGVLVAGVGAAVLGLYQYLDYLAFGVAEEMLIPWLLPPTWGIRLSGIYYQSNLFALLLVLCLLAFAWLLLYGDRPVVRHVFWPLRWLPVGLVAFVFLLTQSRAGWISLATVLALLIWAALRHRLADGVGQRTELVRMLGTIAGAFVLYWVLMHGAFEPAKVETSSAAGGAPAVVSAIVPGGPVLTSAANRSHSDDQRLVLWAGALLMFRDHPWLGVGLDNYKYQLPQYQLAAHDLLRVVEYEALGHNACWAHNEYLQLVAEGGLPALVALTAMVALFLVSLRRSLRRQGGAAEPRMFFCHLFLLPFLLQSLFEWPLRYPPLGALFLAFAGILLAGGSGWEANWRVWPRRLAVFLLLAGMTVGLWLFGIEWQIGRLRDNLVRTSDLKENIVMFQELAYNPYSQYRILNDFLPKLVRLAAKTGDDAIVGQLVAAAETLVQQAGGYWQWYTLALLYDMAGAEDKAYEAVKMTIERNPVFETAWVYLHQLNVRRAAAKTGRSVESFLPARQIDTGVPDERKL